MTCVFFRVLLFLCIKNCVLFVKVILICVYIILFCLDDCVLFVSVCVCFIWMTVWVSVGI